MAQVGWDAFKAAAVKDFVTRSHINLDVGHPIAQVIQELTNLGFEPRDFVNWANSTLGAPLPHHVRAPKPTLAKQGASETIDVFLDRVNVFFRQSRVAPHDHLSFLLEAGLPAVQQMISCLSSQNVTDYDAVCTELRQAFLPSRTQLQTEFSDARRLAGESFHVFGQRLLELYRRILQFDQTQMTQHAPALILPLLAQLLKFEKKEICGFLNQKFDKNRQIPFRDLCAKADAYDQSHQVSTAASTSKTAGKQPSPGSSKYCTIHKKHGHWTSECFRNPTASHMFPDQQQQQQRQHTSSSRAQWNQGFSRTRKSGMLADGRSQQAAITAAVDISHDDSHSVTSENDN